MDIDREIAERIMGWTLKSGVWHDANGTARAYSGDSGAGCNPPMLVAKPWKLVAAWRPHIDIAQAFEVVNKLNDDGGCFSLINDDFGHWACVSDGIQPAEAKYTGQTVFYIEDGSLWCDTPADAICRAALAAVGGEG